jgi:predicted NUDIX family NTP pyrophosphohydrolase
MAVTLCRFSFSFDLCNLSNLWIIHFVMPRKSAGILMYRKNRGVAALEILLVHPGGPFWRNKDDGAWTIPKGEFGDDEDPLEAAKREFKEETGGAIASNEFTPLKPIKQAGGKLVYAWAVEGDFDTSTLDSNRFLQEWPPRSGRMQEFPEIDRAQWFPPELAKAKILNSQVPLIDQLLRLV